MLAVDFSSKPLLHDDNTKVVKAGMAQLRKAIC